MIVTVISAVSLSFLQNLTKPARLAEAAEQRESALKVVLPDAAKYEDEKGMVDGKKFDYFKGTDDSGNIVGYAATGQAFGYSSILQVMVGVDKGFKIVAIKVLSQKETPGLGDKVNEILSKKTIVGMIEGKKYDETGLCPWFQIQFDGKATPVKVQKDGGEIDAITGATISSRAVCKAVNQAAEKLKKALKK